MSDSPHPFGSAARRWLVLALPYLWLVMFFLVPFLVVAKISVSVSQLAQPPYMPLLSWDDDEQLLAVNLHLGNFIDLIETSRYWQAYLISAGTAAETAFLCLVIGYPMAYAIARARPRWRPLLLMLIIMPFWTSFLIRVYAWIGILKPNGLLNGFLIWTGLIREPLQILDTQAAVVIGMVYAYLPFMVLPLYANLEKLDVSLVEAAADLGARPLRTFWSITWPLSLPGVVAGLLLVFIPTTGEYIIPTLLGGGNSVMIGTVLWDDFFNNHNWPAASAVAVALVAFLVVPLMALDRYRGRSGA